MKRAIGVLLVVGLSACGGGGGGGDEPKDLFSLWTNTDTGAPMDLRGAEFSTPFPVSFYFVDGSQCDCTLNIVGTQSDGSYFLNACVYRYGTGDRDPGCNALDGTGNYAKTSDTLTISPSSGAPSTYK